MVRIVGALLCLALALTAPPAGAEERVTRLTLEDALVLAERENAALRAKQFEHQSVKANEITAGLRPNPTASYLAEQFGAATDPQYTVVVGQPIETGGKRKRRVESARAATRVSGWELADVRRQLRFQVQSAFKDVLVGQATLALAEQNLKNLDEIERIQRVRAAKGDISELELLRIQVQRFAFERDAADARQAIRTAKIALRAAVGRDRVGADYEIAGDLAFRNLQPALDELYHAALANRPDLRAAEASREKARADVNLARANAWWDVTPQIEYQRIGNDNTIGFGLSIPLRVFDRNQGEIARTQAEVRRTDALREQARIHALADVDTAFSALQTERTKVVALRDTYLPKAKQARDTVEYAYRRGGVSLLDFLDAQRTYRETAVEHLRALGNYWGAVYQLEAAVGGPLGN